MRPNGAASRSRRSVNVRRNGGEVNVAVRIVYDS